MKLLLKILSFILIFDSCSAEDTAIKLKSPNGNYELVGDRDMNNPFEIRNLTTGKTESKINALSPILSTMWLKNSESIVIVSHISGGSIMAVINRKSEGWTRLDFAPPSIKSAKYGIVSIIETNGSIETKYRVRYNDSGVGEYRYGTIKFTVDPSKDTVSNIIKENISLEDYRKIEEIK